MELAAVFALYVGYVLFLYGATNLVPGLHYKGTPAQDGKRYDFKLNGLAIFGILVATFYLLVKAGVLPGTLIYDNYSNFLICANIIAFAFAFYLYFKGWVEGAQTGLLHFWEGTQLMPYVAGVNAKMFWLKPSMMMWEMINLSCLVKHLELNDGNITVAMALYNAFTLFYITDYFYYEQKMTSTWDIIAEHFGLMLVWGDFVFIPFVFSMQSLVLVDPKHYTDLTLLQAALMAGVFVTGYSIFRQCNNQKDHFKMQGKSGKIWGKPIQTIDDKLLASGWWGVARHANYLGDITLAVSFSLPTLACGVPSSIPNALLSFGYPLYLVILLVHRDYRDDQRCRAKYKDTWEKYCKAVPYRIFPGIY